MKKLILILATTTISVVSYAQSNQLCWTKVAQFGTIDVYKNLSTFKIENSSDVHVFVKYSVTVTNSTGDKIEIHSEDVIKPKSFISNNAPFFGDNNNFVFTSMCIKKIM